MCQFVWSNPWWWNLHKIRGTFFYYVWTSTGFSKYLSTTHWHNLGYTLEIPMRTSVRNKMVSLRLLFIFIWTDKCHFIAKVTTDSLYLQVMKHFNPQIYLINLQFHGEALFRPHQVSVHDNPTFCLLKTSISFMSQCTLYILRTFPEWLYHFASLRLGFATVS